MSTDTPLLKTPLHALHTELGARLVPFVGVVLACLMVITYVPALSLALRDLVYR